MAKKKTSISEKLFFLSTKLLFFQLIFTLESIDENSKVWKFLQSSHQTPTHPLSPSNFYSSNSKEKKNEVKEE